MTDKDCDALLRGALTPYTREEFEQFAEMRKIKTLWEYFLAYAYESVMTVHSWLDWKDGKTMKPASSLNIALRPGESIAHPSGLRMRQITAHYATFEHGAHRAYEVVKLVSKETLTLLERLKELHHTLELDKSTYHFTEWITLALYEGLPHMDKETFAASLRKHCDGFLASIDAYCDKLFDFENGLPSKEMKDTAILKMAENSEVIKNQTLGLKQKVSRIEKAQIEPVKKQKRFNSEKRRQIDLVKMRYLSQEGKAEHLSYQAIAENVIKNSAAEGGYKDAEKLGHRAAHEIRSKR